MIWMRKAKNQNIVVCCCFQVVAKNMGLDTRSNASLWKDFAMVELNYAVLYSFQVIDTEFVLVYGVMRRMCSANSFSSLTSYIISK